MNASANRSGATASIPRSRISPRKSSRSNQCLPAWLGKCRSSSVDLLLRDRRGQRHEEVRRPEVAVELRDLVLEDQVVAERVPGQLAGKPVVLVEVVAGVGEDELRVDPALQLLEELLDLAARVGEEAVPEPVDLDARRARRRRGRPAALARASSPRSPEAASTTQSTSRPGFERVERQQRSAAADLDVVGVAADREHATQRLSRATGSALEHQQRRGARAGAEPGVDARAPRPTRAAPRAAAGP